MYHNRYKGRSKLSPITFFLEAIKDMQNKPNPNVQLYFGQQFH